MKLKPFAFTDRTSGTALLVSAVEMEFDPNLIQRGKAFDVSLPDYASDAFQRIVAAMEATTGREVTEGAVAEWVLAALRCPRCRGALDVEDSITCSSCGAVYTRVDERPVLLDADRSLVGPSDLSANGRSPAASLVSRLLPPLGRSRGSAENYGRLATLLQRSEQRRPRVLVVGGRILGAGIERLLEGGVDMVETDIALGPRTAIVCDAQQLPFADGTFDAVVAQAVLAMVPDAEEAVAELHRVLCDEGLIYAEDSFIQQVWGGSVDFHRWTPLGHRRLFRTFEEIASGVLDGPGTALAWSWHYFLLSFARSRRARKVLQVAGRVSGFWPKYFDAILCRRPGAFDAASGVYFLGRKSERVLSDRELVAGYRGLVGS